MKLTIEKIPTLYSLAQLDENDETNEFVEKTPDMPIRKLEGCNLPLYRFPKKTGFLGKKIRSFGRLEDFSVPDMDNESSGSVAENPDEECSDSSSAQTVPQRSILDGLIISEWEDRADKGLFRYDVTACPTHTIDGIFGFIAQLNEGRASKKRPTEFCVDKVDQPFDDSKFNFCKALQKEALFQFEEGFSPKAEFKESSIVSSSPNLILINVSPIEYGHILLVPNVLDNLQQLMTPDALLLALKFAHEANNPYLRVGYNSLGAYATINHLHFQAYYLAAPMPLERAKTNLIQSRASKGGLSHINIHKLADYPVKGLVFEAGDSMEEMASLIGGLCQRLALKNIPFNIMIVDRGARVFLIPNAFSERKARSEIPEDVLESQVDPAVFEISGHIVLKRKEDYDCVDETWVWRLLEHASVTDDKFEEVLDLCLF